MLWHILATFLALHTGEIPLRDLVYRVLQIPDSLKALVYDFGKLDSSTERDYIYQIVQSRLKDVSLLVVNTISGTWCWHFSCSIKYSSSPK